MSTLKLILKIVCGIVIVAAIAVGAYYLINKFVGEDDDEDPDEFDSSSASVPTAKVANRANKSPLKQQTKSL